MAVQAAMAGLEAVRWVRLPAAALPIGPRSLPFDAARFATEWLCAERGGHPPLALAALRPDARQAWMVGQAIEQLVEESLPPMRPGSVGAALALAAASTLWAPFALAAVGYGGWRASRRALLRHRLRTEIECALHRLIVTGEAPDYRSVRSFQISGNSTTSSILRR